MKDHVITHISRKKTNKDLWEALTNIYQSDNKNRKMVLREKLKGNKITRSHTIDSYLTMIA